MSKIYQVCEKHFYISNGTDYLNACSPFNRGVGYKKKETALSIAKSLYEQYRDANNNGHCSNNNEEFVAIVFAPTMRIVITIEEIIVK